MLAGSPSELRSLFPNASREEVDLLRVLGRTFGGSSTGRSAKGVGVACIWDTALAAPAGTGRGFRLDWLGFFPACV